MDLCADSDSLNQLNAAEAAIGVVSAQGAASLFRIEDFIRLIISLFVRFSPLSDQLAL